MTSRICLKNDRIFAGTILLSLFLVGCGGSSSSDGNAAAVDANTADTTDTTDTTATPVDETAVDTANQPEERAILEPTDDIATGGYVGSSGPLRLSLPEIGAGYKFGVIDSPSSAQFGSFNTTQRFQEYISDFARPLDSCHHTGLTPFTGFGERFTVPFAGFTFISAGEILPVLGPGGSVGELELNSSGYFGTPDTSNIPSSDLSISVPGDEFPAYGTNSFPETDPLTGFRELNSSLFDFRSDFDLSEITTVFWDPSDDPDAFIHLEFFADSLDGGALASFHCTLQDDGEFTFPQEILDIYAGGVAAAEIPLVARVKVKQLTQDDSMLLLLDVKRQ